MSRRSLRHKHRRPMSIRKLSYTIALTALSGSVACAVDSSRWPDGLQLRPNDDIMTAGSAVAVTDSVTGDVMMAGGSVEFDGFAGGSYLGAGSDQGVGGLIEGSVRAAGGAVRLEASVGRNATLAGGSIEVREAADIRGNAYLAGGTVRLDGTVSGDVYVGAGEFVLDGNVGGDVRVEGGALRIGPDARIGGQLRYRLKEGESPSISADAVVAGGVLALQPREDAGGRTVFLILRLLAFVFSGAVVVALFPKALIGTVGHLQDRPATAAGLGLVWGLLIPLAVFVLALTIVGIPLALMLAALYGLSLYLAPVVPALWIGGQILGRRDPSDRKRAVLIFVTGGVIVAFVLSVPGAGLVARVVATWMGLGAFVLAIGKRGASSRAA